ncbi:DNA-binding Lrp family transcriptional regulator [Streptomyces griseochromogenes]|uniref:AsnC family transcriptional regulator n=1 Tax=Streptomyces griseochromogenes TaxID=68214 RepID=A0A1B1B7T4_9ACTN|nr:Lrp/AsnC family transcriptional regulator [Streptomyces griseochromogenes]ANP54847.1 AsnC family transcriptional regulator [Streptomyces griseochromogenes]MBP2048573.1 DNA-binding Lrp family transcriptional regulator [Streptomyces griseochromogenes]
MKTDTVTLDDIDRGLVHALQIDGRAPFRLIGEALGVSENTVARRYRRLRGADVLRVVGTLNGARLGYNAWTIRLRCTPDSADAISKALAARPDTSYVHLLSGGTEISCSTQTPTSDESEALLLNKLPRTSRITSVSAHLLLGNHALPNNWAGPARLAPEQAALLAPPPAEDGDVSLGPADRPLFDLLSRDGRASHTELAAATGWSEATVRRRLIALRRAGALVFLVDIPPAALGFRTEARLWMSVRPSRLTAVAAALAAHPEVSLVAQTTGQTNLLAAVNCRDSLDLARYLTERVASLDAIHTMETAPVIRTVKRSGALLPLERRR